MLDNILEEFVDQYFHSLIQTWHMQRRRDVVDDNLAAEVIEEIGDNGPNISTIDANGPFWPVIKLNC